MGVPNRFAIEYSQRALDLIRFLEEHSKEKELIGTFGLLSAAAVLTIPFERMKRGHFLHDKELDWDLSIGLKRLEKVNFSVAPFWTGEQIGEWRESRICSPVDKVDHWEDESGIHPLSPDAQNTIGKRSAEHVIRVLRNALAHGNIIYLDKRGQEVPGNRMAYMAFLSRYEDTDEARRMGTTYRLIVTDESEFLHFVKRWAAWISGLALDQTISDAA